MHKKVAYGRTSLREGPRKESIWSLLLAGARESDRASASDVIPLVLLTSHHAAGKRRPHKTNVVDLIIQYNIGKIRRIKSIDNL
ncbi:hypothetical protein C0J52_19290 [Blattella germanica]|nr:hypothetical protein C0J52_19290 [Blattella germanica]